MIASETEVREALRSHLMTAVVGARDSFDELWVPQSNERADIAVVGTLMHGFEIKTERDTLKRLPRQITAYGRIFDRCTAAVAERHVDNADQLLPEWWGVTVVRVNGSVAFTPIRKPKPNPAIDPEILVRLLWKDEVTQALTALGFPPERQASRGMLWNELLRCASLTQIRAAVRRALLSRDATKARISTRRFSRAPAQEAGG